MPEETQRHFNFNIDEDTDLSAEGSLETTQQQESAGCVSPGIPPTYDAADDLRKYCYRHRPDVLRRRATNESTLVELREQMEKLPLPEQNAITNIWSTISAAPPQHRCLILQGILAECCLSQLSFLSQSLNDLIRIDFMDALPKEVSLKILSYLDAISLCHAAQVSKTWKQLADDDVIWHKMCEQHIDRKCTKCGWGLPLLEKKRRYKKRRSLEDGLASLPSYYCSGHDQLMNISSPSSTSSTASSVPTSPGYVPQDDSRESKRARVSENNSTPLFPPIGPPTVEPPRTRPWKDVYSERLAVERNWRKGRYTERTLRGHTDGVMCLQYDNNTLITGSYDATVRVWNVETGEAISVLRGHQRCVRGLQFDNAKLITCSMDRTVRIWDYHTSQCIRTLDGYTDGVICLHFDDRILVSGSADAVIKVWNFATAECFTLTGHQGMVNRVIIYEKTLLFSCSDDSTIRVWNLNTRTCLRELSDDHVAQVQCIQPALPSLFKNILPSFYQCSEWHHEHNFPVIVSASLDNAIRIWSIQTGECLYTLFGHVEGIWALAFDKLRMVSGSQDRTVKIWDLDSGKCLYTLRGHDAPVNCVALGDTRIITADNDAVIKIWDFKD